MTEFDNQIMETNLLYATHTHSEVKVKQQLPRPTKTKNGKRKVNVQICLYKKKTKLEAGFVLLFFLVSFFRGKFSKVLCGIYSLSLCHTHCRKVGHG